VSSAHEPSGDAERIWRALEMTHERMSRMEREHEERQAELPRLLADALKTAYGEVLADPSRQAAFWQGGVDHVRATWQRGAGRTVSGMLWGVVQIGAVLLVVLSVFGPSGFKALLATWLGVK
jgi:hypothetical protein